MKKSSRVWRRCGSSDKSAKRESNSNVADVVRGGMPWAFAGVASGWSDGEGSGELHCGGNLAIERAGIEPGKFAAGGGEKSKAIGGIERGLGRAKRSVLAGRRARKSAKRLSGSGSGKSGGNL